jgi:hypothetical protein
MVATSVFLPIRKARMFEGLGNSADQVARSLQAKGFKGVRNTVRTLNPFVRYAHTLIPEAIDIHVITDRTLTVSQPSGAKEEIPVPEAVLAFLEAFNRGAYPELEMKT